MDIHVELTENMKQYLHFIHDNVYMNILICIIAAVLSKLMYNYHAKWRNKVLKPRVRTGPIIYNTEDSVDNYFMVIILALISVFYFFKIILFI